MLYNEDSVVTLSASYSEEQYNNTEILMNLPNYDSYWELTKTSSTLESGAPKTYSDYYNEVVD